MAKQYWLKFGQGAPSATAGLSPTFINFIKFDGTTLAAPGITQPMVGIGLYQFTWSASFSVAFTVDGATSGLATNDRYINGAIDPVDRIDELLGEQGSTLNSIGSTITGIGNTLLGIGVTVGGGFGSIGTTASAIGDSSTSPVDLFGYLKRVRELLEGNQNYVKSTQVWSLFDRSGATLLATKTLTNNSTQVIRG